jgi:hypothetical protein
MNIVELVIPGRRQYVFTITAESLAPVALAVESCVAGQACSIHTCRTPADGFAELSGDLHDCAAMFERGELQTVLVRPESGPIEFSLIHHPSVHGRNFSLYSATFEYTSKEWPNLWNLLLSLPGLRTVSLGMEEGVELADSSLSPEWFPWNEWPLIIGAVRSDGVDGRWVVREGPEMKGMVRSDAEGALGRHPVDFERYRIRGALKAISRCLFRWPKDVRKVEGRDGITPESAVRY